MIYKYIYYINNDILKCLTPDAETPPGPAFPVPAPAPLPVPSWGKPKPKGRFPPN